MEQKFPSSELYSHPDKLLENHLVGVAHFADVFLREKPLHIYEKIKNIVQFSALFHDLGKSTNFFQKYITSAESDKFKNEFSQHSFLSSIMGLFESSKHLSSFDASLVFLAIKHHHGNLNYTVFDFNIDDNDVELLLTQIESIDREKFRILVQNIDHSGFELEFNLDEFNNWVQLDLKKYLRELKRIHKKLEPSPLNYLMLNIIYSVLLDADKSDVVVGDKQVYTSRTHLPLDLVDKFKIKTNFQASSINSIREKAYNEIVRHNIDTRHKIYSINLPTGLGKTLASLSFALKLRNQLDKNHRIIYCLPFLSIIDQNFNVFENVLRTYGIDPTSDVILKHHHLSDIRYEHSKVELSFKSEIDQASYSDWARILIEGWNSEIIVTTFVQFFHTLVSYNNRSLRKFHRLANSIIILDEVQSIPIKYWQLTRKLLLDLTEQFNSYVIFVTATQPMIFEPNEIMSVCSHNQYFESLNRITIFSKVQQPITLDELVRQFNFNGRTHLFIFNTIGSAKAFYNKIIDANIVSKSEVTFLSAHIIPKVRRERIEQIKKNNYKIVISTQLVEAGVDIDFDVVVRDIAPLDSIIQSAGRCNRNAETKGEVYVFNIVENGKRLANYIYDRVLLDLTESILKTKSKIEEPELLDLSQQYFLETTKRKSNETAVKFLEAISNLIYDHPDEDTIKIKDFNLIEYEYPTIDVYVEIDEIAREIWEKFVSLKKIKNRFKRKNEFDKFKADFYDFVISIPRFALNQPVIEFDLGYVSNDLINVFYDNDTGYKVKEQTSTLMF